MCGWGGGIVGADSRWLLWWVGVGMGPGKFYCSFVVTREVWLGVSGGNASMML